MTIYVEQGCTVFKGFHANVSERGGKGDRLQGRAVMKSTHFDLSDAFGKIDADEGFTFGKSIGFYIFDVTQNSTRVEAGTIAEQFAFDAGDTPREYDFLQMAASPKSGTSDGDEPFR